MTTASIIQAAPEDAEALARVHVVCWRETYQGLLPHEVLEEISVEDRASRWREILATPPMHGGPAVYIATDTDNTILGFGSCGKSGTPKNQVPGYDGEFQALYVLREAQGVGLGRQLMSLMTDDLIARGCTSAATWVLRENTPARRFYEHLGGNLVGEREDMRCNGEITLHEVAYGWDDLWKVLII